MIDVNLKQFENAYEEMQAVKEQLLHHTDALEETIFRIPEVLKDEETDILMRRLRQIRSDLFDEVWKLRLLQDGLIQADMVYSQTEYKLAEEMLYGYQKTIIARVQSVEWHDIDQMTRDVLG